jgi:glycosyltransferase involved in cell wall biosynthesis
MNILYFTNEYKSNFTPPCGGIGTFIKVISDEIVKNNDHEVIIVFLSNVQKIIFDNKKKIIFVKKTPSTLLKKISKFLLPKNLFFKVYNNIERLYLALQLKKIVKHNNISIVEAYDYLAYFKYFNLLKIPIVVRCHGSASMLKEHFGYSSINNMIVNYEKEVFSNAKNVLSVSNYSKEININYFTSAKIKTIYNGIDTELFKSIKDISIREYSIYYFGTLSNHKGFLELLNIFKIIHSNNSKATLNFIGRGKKLFLETLQLEDYKKIKQSILYHGVLSQEELVLEVNRAHLIMFPSKGENFPFSFLEAMSMEKPIIVSDIGVSKEIINHKVNGYIAKTMEDYVSFSNEIFEKKNDSNRMSSLARQSIIDRFSLKKMYLETIKYYSDILNNDVINR